MSDPKFNYTPDDPSTLIKKVPIVTTYKTAVDETNDIQSAKMKVTLTKLFTAGFNNVGDKRTAIHNATITIQSLDHVVEAFDTLIADPNVKNMLSRMIDRGGGKAFMITSVKTFSNAEISTVKKQATELKANLTVPIEAAISGNPGIGALDPTLGLARSREREWNTSHVADEEQIYAIQYRLVEKHSRWRLSAESFYSVGRTEFHEFGTMNPHNVGLEEDGELVLREDPVQIFDLPVPEGWEEIEDVENYLIWGK